MFGFLLWLLEDALFLLGHLSGGGSFPKPLSHEEEARCIALSRAGDESARHKLIEHNLRLVAHIVKKYTVPGYTQDDLVSVGTLGLIKAVRTYDPAAKTSLSTYSAKCIENEVLMLLRAQKKRQGEVSLQEAVGTDGEGNDITFIDILASPEVAVEEEVIRRISAGKVREALDKLPAREKTVLLMRYGLLDGVAHPQHDVADKLEISRSYVSRLEKRAILLLRQSIFEEITEDKE